MPHGMSEDEVKRRLYGDYGDIKKAPEKKPPPRGPVTKKIEPVAKKPKPPPLPLKPIFIIVGIAIFLTIIFGAVRSCRISSGGASGQIKGYFSQGKKYYNEGMFDEAILTWKNILAVDPANRSALRYIQRAELKKKELKIREEEIARKLKEMLAKREKEEAEKKQREEQKEYGHIIKAEAENLLKEGDAYLKEKNFPKAIAAYEKVLKLSPGNRHAVKNMARAEKGLAGYKKAEETKLKEAVSIEKEAGARYRIQVATYADEINAKKLAAQLIGKGYQKVSVSKLSSKAGKSWYCVYYGSFASKKDAEKEMQKIKKGDFKDALVKTLK